MDTATPPPFRSRDFARRVRLLLAPALILLVSRAWAAETPAAGGNEGVAAPTVYSAPDRVRAEDGSKLPAQFSRTIIDHDDPSKSVPPESLGTKNPLEWGYILMDLSLYGDFFFDKKEYTRAAKYFLATAKMVPQRSVPFSRLCAAYVGAGDMHQAREACHEALFRAGVVPVDFERYFRLLLETKPKLGPEDIEKVDAAFAHLSAQKVEKPELFHFACEIGLRLENVPRVEQCVSVLTARWPNDPRTITFQWSLALLKKDPAGAEAAIRRAKAGAMSPEGLKKMEAATEALKSGGRSKYLLPASGGVLLAIVTILLVVSLRRSRTRPA